MELWITETVRMASYMYVHMYDAYRSLEMSTGRNVM
jgi:hypothetical protein